jgi:hypothetical protein
VRIEVVASNIPERLRSLNRWVVWRWQRRNKSWDKPPLRLEGSFASVDDPTTWTTFEEALAAHLAGDFDGIGFVLGYVAEEDVTYTGVDLDDCRDPQTGAIADWAAAHIQMLNTYSEISPSGQGVKALAMGKLPGPDRNDSQKTGIEMYSGNRYFTITGHPVTGSSSEIGDRTAQLADLYYQLFTKVKQEVPPGKERLPDRELALSALGGLNSSLASNYLDWLRVGMALHSVGSDRQMLEAWDSWSRQCPEKYQPGACEAKWQSLGKKGGLGIGSLIHWAREAGWEMPKSGRKTESSAQADASTLERLDTVLADGAEAFFRDKELLEALARLAETDHAEFACVRAKVQKVKISLRSLDNALAPLRQELRAKRPRPDSGGAYRVVGGRIVHMRTTPDGHAEVPLCNFSAFISEVVTRDDGVEQSAVFTIEGSLADGQPLPRLQVVATDYQRMEWLTPGWHGAAVVYAGQGTRDHLRCGIELLSRDRVKRLQYLHTGWCQIGREWYFLHTGGAIGVDGLVSGIEVDLPGALAGIHLPPPPTGERLMSSIRSSLDLLIVGPDRVTIPVLGATYRAPMGNVDFSVHLHGPSGTFKSELASLAQRHYGQNLDARSLPGCWLSTENALEELAFGAKDVLFVIDDFKPVGSTYEVYSYHRKADRLFRAVGNHSGRQRLSKDGKLRPDHRPRGLVLSTGEEIPNGESLRARLAVLSVGPGDIDMRKLAHCQRDAAAGQYSDAMSAYVCWLAPKLATLRTRVKARRDEFLEKARASAELGHARSPGVMADLALGLHYFLDFALEAGAIDTDEYDAVSRRCWAALQESAAEHDDHIRAAEPTALFSRLLTAAIASGRAHLAGPDGGPPAQASVWGWRQIEAGTSEHQHQEWRPQGTRVGWVDRPQGSAAVGLVGLVGSENVYLEPEASFAAVQALGREQGECLTISSRTLRQRLHDKGLLASTDEGRGRLTVRRTLDGCRREVLHVAMQVLWFRPDQPDQENASA